MIPGMTVFTQKIVVDTLGMGIDFVGECSNKGTEHNGGIAASTSKSFLQQCQCKYNGESCNCSTLKVPN